MHRFFSPSLSLGLGALVACQASEHGLHSQSAPTLRVAADPGDGGAFAVFEVVEGPGSAGSSPADPPRSPAWGGGASVAPLPTAPSPDASHPAVDARPDAPPATPDPPSPVVREAHFRLGAGPTPVVDYLFVIDDSVSMKQVLGRFRRGMRHLAEPGVFPQQARLAVLHTTPADPADPHRAHPAVRQNSEADLLPGFQELVDGAAIAAYLTDAPAAFRARFPLAGCRAWFAPADRSPDGPSCLQAHSQLGLVHSRAEAGLVALAQWLEALEAAEVPQFRAGAAVNVVFVSDTHDPGLPPGARDTEVGQDLLELQPTFDDLRDRLNVPVASLRVHAIAPRARCGEAWDVPAYHDVAEASGGVVADVCTLDDYSALVRKIAHSGARVQEPVVRLGRSPEAVLSVTLDGAPVDWWREGRAVGLRTPEPGGELVVRYRAAGP